MAGLCLQSRLTVVSIYYAVAMQIQTWMCYIEPSCITMSPYVRHFHIILYSLFLRKQFIWQQCEKRPLWCLLKHMVVILLTKRLCLSSTSTVVHQIALVLLKDWNNVPTVMSLILHLSHTFISGLFVMSWRRRDQTILVSTAVSQKLCACVHNDEGLVKSSQHINFHRNINLRNLLHCSSVAF